MITEALSKIQLALKAPKSERNTFGKYNYRSCEGILEAVKPCLKDENCAITITDNIFQAGERIYIKATATLHHKDQSISAEGFAREPLNRKGMDDSQITGATSSYARKYALCGLLAIDDNRDPDATNTHSEEETGINMEETTRLLKEAVSLENLQAIFAHAWQAANKDQRNTLKEIYDQRKADFEAAKEN